jgi:hypothetical protein
MIAIAWVLGILASGTLVYSLVGLLLDRHNIDWQKGKRELYDN